jgi:hypothetical protein
MFNEILILPHSGIFKRKNVEKNYQFMSNGIVVVIAFILFIKLKFLT